jgi:lauroyl/myristoyl acyltransferase
LYRSEFWSAAKAASSTLPEGISVALSKTLAAAYWHISRRRREVVIRNLMVPLKSREAARTGAKALYRNFSQKLLDLWRYESGRPIASLFKEWNGWEHFEAAQATGRGILVVTPHLGNWEFGAPLLAERGVKLLVITLAEPNAKLTKMRQLSRAKWGVETLVIGEDPFGFIEVIRRLEAGCAVALLIDRPPARSAVPIQFLGNKFMASVAAAELARATGCHILPVYLPRLEGGYGAYMMPSFPYDRAGLRRPQGKQELTQALLKLYEPVVEKYANQWYHFVPIWPDI